MKRSEPDQHRKLLDLLTEVLAVAKTLVQPMPAAAPGHNVKRKAPGIYPHQSKYNPWRAYVWDTRTRRSVYLGAFPSVAKARAAQQSYRDGLPVTTGTRASKASLRRVA